MKQVCECLRMIERTRLLCNTQEGLAELVGSSIKSGNGLVRKGGNSLFMKEAILRQLASLAAEETGMDLEKVVDAYGEVDTLLDKYASRLKGKDVCNQLVRYFYGDGEVAEDLVEMFGKVERRLAPILVLMLQGVLPRLSAKSGDVRDIKEDYIQVFGWLHQVATVNIPTQSLPVLSQFEEKVNKDSSVMCRLHLIYMVERVLNAYGSMSTPESLSLTNREMQKELFYPDVEGIWVENDTSTVFWIMEKMAKGFSLYRYALNSEKRKLTYESYTIRFCDKGDAVMVMVTHPKIIQYILSGKPVPNGCHAFLNCELKDGQIELSPLMDDSAWFKLRHLQRSCHAEYFQKLLDDERYTKEDTYAEYAYHYAISLAAITAENIYITAPEGGFYQVPKSLNPVLEDTQFGDNVGIITYANSLYLAFDDKLLYYDVSTEDIMSQLNIKKVHSISV